MKVTDLRLHELLDFPAAGGRISFAGQRALLLDAAALGLLRKELIDSLGAATARCLLTRFGYAHGWRTAEALEGAIPWDSPREWERAGSRLHMLLGMVDIEPVVRTEAEGPPPFAECLWRHSYEAEQHRTHIGPAEEPVCWTLTGFASGYLSRVQRRQVLCVETRCAGRGDPVCQLVGEFAEDWGERLPDVRSAYEWTGLNAELRAVTARLKEAESRLQRARREIADDQLGIAEVVARSKAMRDTIALARRVAPFDSTVLITGPSGTGKERIARLVHKSSPRSSGPFIAVNCAAVGETVLESELFGHVAGAFTGASRDRKGFFEAASGGTLLLDEVGETSPAMQSKLLRVLQEREVRPVGSSASRPFDTRILAATSRDLDAEVEAGRFRKDLLYRLRVIELRMLPLAERRDDIPELARMFVEHQAQRLRRHLLGLTPEALELLLRHDWPGNVRELEHAIEHGAILASGDRIAAGDLPLTIREAATVAPPAQSLAAIEAWAIRAALQATDGNRTAAAARLEIGISTLYRKLRKYGLEQA